MKGRNLEFDRLPSNSMIIGSVKENMFHICGLCQYVTKREERAFFSFSMLPAKQVVSFCFWFSFLLDGLNILIFLFIQWLKNNSKLS